MSIFEEKTLIDSGICEELMIITIDEEMNSFGVYKGCTS